MFTYTGSDHEPYEPPSAPKVEIEPPQVAQVPKIPKIPFHPNIWDLLAILWPLWLLLKTGAKGDAPADEETFQMYIKTMLNDARDFGIGEHVYEETFPFTAINVVNIISLPATAEPMDRYSKYMALYKKNPNETDPDVLCILIQLYLGITDCLGYVDEYLKLRALRFGRETMAIATRV